MKNHTPEYPEVLEQSCRSEIEWPRIYRIVVTGRLDASLSELLAGMRITRPGGPQTETSVLFGSIRDSAELSGVLNTLHDQRLSLLSVELVEEAESDEAA